jgi:hypothetical protein
VLETKGLSLEQIDKMMEESSPRTSVKWKLTKIFALVIGNEGGTFDVGDIERKGSIF